MKNYLLFYATFFLCLSGYSQTTRYGLTLGGNFTELNGKGVNNTYSLGFITGAYAKAPLNDKWTLQPELFFNFANAQKGDDFLEVYNDNGNQNARNSIELSYISVPVLFEYKVTKLLALDAGPQYDFLLDDNENLVANGNRAFKVNNLSVSGGAELNLTGIRVFANYVLGVSNVNDIDNRYKWHKNQALVGFNFNIL